MVVGFSEGLEGTVFIFIDGVDDKALRLMSLGDLSSGHFCFAASRCFCCHAAYSLRDLAFKAP